MGMEKMNRSIATSNRILRLALLSPAALVLTLTTLVPILYMVVSSLYRLDPVLFNRAWPFVGLGNYVDVLTKDPMFWSSMQKTVLFLLYTITPQIAVGMFLAVLLFREFKGKALVQTLMLFPILTTPVVISMIWKYFFDFDTGFLNVLLIKLGLPPQTWLSTKGFSFITGIPGIGPWLASTFSLNWAFASIVFVNFWQWAPFCFLVFYAGLTALPLEVFDACRVDGATRWQTFRFVTLPLLRPVVWIVVFLRIIDCLKVYAQIWVIFGNAEPTRIINVHLYTIGFTMSDYGRASALGVITLLFIALILVGNYLLGGKSHESSV
jgi:multiple sugar transport system permease protein